MKRRFLLYIVVTKRALIFKLLPSEDESLLIRRDALLILDFRFHFCNRCGRLDVESDRLSSECLDEDLHVWFV